MAEEYPDLTELKEWAVESRYPGGWLDADEPDAASAVQKAAAVWSSICSGFRERGIGVE